MPVTTLRQRRRKTRHTLNCRKNFLLGRDLRFVLRLASEHRKPRLLIHAPGQRNHHRDRLPPLRAAVEHHLLDRSIRERPQRLPQPWSLINNEALPIRRATKSNVVKSPIPGLKTIFSLVTKLKKFRR